MDAIQCQRNPTDDTLHGSIASNWNGEVQRCANWRRFFNEKEQAEFLLFLKLLQELWSHSSHLQEHYNPSKEVYNNLSLSTEVAGNKTDW